MNNISSLNFDLNTVELKNLDLKQLPRSIKDKLKNMLTPKMSKYCPHVPTAKQAAYLILPQREAFYGGAAGGGKSDCLLMAALQHVDKQGYAAIIFRKTYADLSKPGALLDRAREWLSPYIKTKEVRWVEKHNKWEFLNSDKTVRAILQFGYLEGEKDKYAYQGGEYQFIGFDEVTHISKTNYTYLFSRCRRPKNQKEFDSSIPLRVRSASNPPDDDQGIWVYNRFVNPATKSEKVIYIPASLEDNPYLDTDEYDETLKELDPVTRARLRHGVWTITRKGNMFKRKWFEFVPISSLPSGRRQVRSWDMACTDAEKSKKKNKSGEPDYTAGIKISEYKGIYYIEDIVRERKDPAGTEALQKNCAVSDGYKCKIVEEIEPGSSGIGVISIKSRTLLKGFRYEGIKSGGDKATRASALSAASYNGLVKIVEGCRNIEDFFNEMETFPGGLHDDMVDGAATGFNFLSLAPKSAVPLFDEYGDEDELAGGNYFTENGLDLADLPKPQ